MSGFRSGSVRILVATDVVGRGIDVSSISHIINYDIPSFCDDYVHRVGRTGRMGREGVAFTFVAPDEGPELTRIEERINRLLKRDEIKDFEPRARERIAAGRVEGGRGEGARIEGDREAHEAGDAEADAAREPALAGAAPPPPPASAMRRPAKRYRRAL
jgi:ATP-dependent RNA helicase DeaD